MPRDGSGIYSIPPGTQGTPDTTIESAKYNAFAADLEADLNAPRPVIAGGTGATNAADARNTLDAERSMQPITNFDADLFEAGSFFAASGATNAPVAGHAFTGITYGPDANNFVVEARDQTTGLMWVRSKAAGVWGAWSADASDKVARAGDTMTGDLHIAKPGPTLFLDRPLGYNDAALVAGRYDGSMRWQLQLGYGVDGAPASNTGADFYLSSFADTGLFLRHVLFAPRVTGLLVVAGNPTDPLGIATKQYVDAAVAALQAQIVREIPAGTNMFIANNVAPQGWTRIVGWEDRGLRIAATGAQAGGNIGWSSVFSRTTTDYWTLSGGDVPTMRLGVHDGSNYFPLWGIGTGNQGGYFGKPNVQFPNSGNTGWAGTAALTFEAGNAPHLHGIDLRLAYIDVLACTKS